MTRAVEETDDEETADGLLVRKVENETLIINTAAGQVHQLNASASIIWDLRCKGASAAQIAAALTDRYRVDADLAQQEVEKTLDQLRALSLIA